MASGKVYLVGAGPGDIGLFTVKGLECLMQADVVVYDRLIDDGLLALARPDAELIYVGKSAKAHAREQGEINQILVDKADEGKIVARLKGGDPFVLGRGGEEAEALSEAGIPFEVVPGVSSAVAAPAYAGIPLTHRQMASSFAVVTGHEDPTKETPAVDWGRLASGVDTIVCLMGMGNLPHIVEALIEGGKSADTPVALIAEGTTPRQRTLTATLATIVEQAERADFEPPAVIVVGEVVKLRESLAWYDKRPLFGKRILVTRSRSQASTLSHLLTERGAEPIELPTIEIADIPDPSELDRAISKLANYDWALFTSANGVEAFWKRLQAMGLDTRHLGGIKIGAIGPATAGALESKGVHPDLVPTKHTGHGLADALATIGIHGCRILLPRADIAPRELAESLAVLGAEAHEVSAYTTKTPSQSTSRASELLEDGKVDMVTFTSSSTVTNLLGLLGDGRRWLDETKIACIGPVTAATAKEAGLKVDIISQEHTITDLVAAMESYFESGEGA